MKPKKLIRKFITERLKEGEWVTITDQKELNQLYALKIKNIEMAKLKGLHREIERLNQESSHYQDLYNQQLEDNAKLKSEKDHMESESIKVVTEMAKIKAKKDKLQDKYDLAINKFSI